jgi:hypothetical protein
MANVTENDTAGFLLLFGKILLVDSIGQGSSCSLVHQTQDIEARGLSSSQHGVALSVIESDWDPDDTVRGLCLQCGLGNTTQVGKEHSCDLNTAHRLQGGEPKT